MRRRRLRPSKHQILTAARRPRNLGFRQASRSSVSERFFDDKLTIVILCNRTDLDPEKFALQVADAYFFSQQAN